MSSGSDYVRSMPDPRWRGLCSAGELETEVEAGRSRDAAGGPALRRAPVSVVCMTAGPGPRVAALLASLRPAVEEILVALDDRAEQSVRDDLARVADRIVYFPYREPVDRPLPWLFEQCGSEWALSVDDDEIPSLALIDALPRLCADEAVGHYWITRRWLFPTPATYLDDAPWRPDYQLRLVRVDRRLVRFSDEFHRPIVASGPSRFVDLPLWHVDSLVRPFERRLEKVRRYERERPGMRIAGRALNVSFYLPEARRSPPLADVHDAERAHVEAVLDAPSPTGPAIAAIDHGTREEIDRLWPETEAVQAGRLALLERPAELIAGMRRTLDIRVHNDSGGTWPWGADCTPRVRIESRWSGDVQPPLWTLLPGPIGPGESDLVPVHIRAPETPGRHRVEIDLVQEHVGSFGISVALDVVVVLQRRIAVIGDDAAVESLAPILEEIPEVELLRLRRTPSLSVDGYPEAQDARSYLFDGAPSSRLAFAATALWRSLRLRVGPTPRGAAPFSDALGRCELLVVAGLDGPPERRERWAAEIAARTAKARGIPVVETTDPARVISLLRQS